MEKFEPLEHQKLMIDFGLSRDRCALFAGMGLGKSASTLKILSERFFNGQIRGALIIAPKRVSNLTWPEEIKKWDISNHMRVCNLRNAIVSAKTKKQKALKEEALTMWNEGSADIYLLSYDLIQRFVKDLVVGRETLPTNCIVFDELHKGKNPSGKRMKALSKFLYHFPYRIGLTGTPLPRGYRDLFAQIRLLDDGERLDHRITYYMRTYFYNPDGRGFNWVLRRGSKEIIDEKLSDLVITLSSEEYLDIPEVHYEDIDVILPPASRKAYMKLENDFMIPLDDGDVVSPSAAVNANKLIQMATGATYNEHGETVVFCDAKLKKLRELVDENLKLGDNLLVVCFYNHEMERILEAIPEAREFHEKDKDEWNAGKIPVWVAKYPSITEGLNLQKGGHKVCWFHPTPVDATFSQLNARLARQGQDERTTIYRLIAVDTADEAAVLSCSLRHNTEAGFFESMKAIRRLR